MVASLQDQQADEGGGFWGAIGDAAGWVGEQGNRLMGAYEDAYGNIIQGDLSGAIGDLAGGYAETGIAAARDVYTPVLGYLGQEAGDVAADL